jgi:hypothetical protein
MRRFALILFNQSVYNSAAHGSARAAQSGGTA